jgi:hypothetical protein
MEGSLTMPAATTFRDTIGAAAVAAGYGGGISP